MPSDVDPCDAQRLSASGGEGGQIRGAANELPDPVDTDEHAEILAELGLQKDDLEGSGEGGLKFGI